MTTGRDISKMRSNTRVATGRARHAERIDARTVWGRRDREVYGAIVADLGGMDRLSELEHQVVRRCVGLVLRCEQFEAQLADGKEVDATQMCAVINAFNRTASLLGLKRRPRDVTPLEDYIARQYGGEG
jgi:hypothetical protein